jgi:hypothetical protein
MDYMAAGRPVVATDLPECRLYHEQFDVVEPKSFVDAVARRIEAGPDDGRALLRLETARENSCRNVAEKLIDWIRPQG